MSRLVTNPVDLAIPELRTESRLREHEQRMADKERVEDYWHQIGSTGEPAFGTGYRAYNTGAGTQGQVFALPAFRKINGIVYLRGLVEKTSAVVAGETIFTLPAGYRPDKTWLLTTMSNSAISRIDIGASGNVIVNAGNALWISLDGLFVVLE